MTSNQNEWTRRRVSIDFSLSSYQALEELAMKRGVSLADALQEAIAISRWFRETKEKGYKILVENNGKIREVVEF